MGRLDKESIQKEIEAKGFEVVDISEYKNLTSPIKIKCKDGHITETTLSIFRRTAFNCPSCVGETSEFTDMKNLMVNTNAYRVVAFDQSSKVTAMSVFDDGKLVYYTVFQISGSLEARLIKFEQSMRKILTRIKPDLVIFEDIQLQQNGNHQNVKTFKTLAMILGIAKKVAAELKLPHREIMNKVWQRTFNITGVSRREQKESVIRTVHSYYNITVSDDEGDAILLGLHAVSQLKSQTEKKLF